MHRQLNAVTSVALAAALAGLLAACGVANRATTTSRPSSDTATSSSASAPGPGGTVAAPTSTTTSVPVSGDGLPPLGPPRAAHPMTLLEIGDSLGQDLGFGLQNELGSNRFLTIVPDAVGDTGLARPDYYDWPAHLASELQQYRPAAVIVFVGGNDGQSMDADGVEVQPFTPAWDSAYAARVATIMNEAISAGARVLWVGMPIMQDPVLSSTMQQLNVIYRAQSRMHPGVTYFSSWGVFSNAAGQFVSAITGPDGEELLRDPDGVHIAGAGYDRLALALIPVMNTAWGLDLKPSST
jgi:hypothetical protein